MTRLNMYCFLCFISAKKEKSTSKWIMDTVLHVYCTVLNDIQNMLTYKAL